MGYPFPHRLIENHSIVPLSPEEKSLHLDELRTLLREYEEALAGVRDCARQTELSKTILELRHSIAMLENAD